MTRDQAMDMLKDESDRAEMLSGLSGGGRLTLMIHPNTGYSTVMTKTLAERLILAGTAWEPVAEFENGKQVEVHRFHLHLK